MKSSSEIKTKERNKEDKWGYLLLMHLLPGALILLVYTLIVKTVSNYGYPKVLAMGISVILILVPTQLGYVLYQSKKISGRFSLKEVIPYREKLTKVQYLGYIVILFLLSGIAFFITAPVSQYLLNNVFQWLPDWFLLNEHYTNFSKSALIVTFFSSLFLTSIIGPIVEEIYFRGYLLPRMKWLGKYAALVNSILFSVYHFWSPWQIITRIIAIFPMIYIVNKKKNIYIGIIAHVLLNITGDTLFLLSLILK